VTPVRKNGHFTDKCDKTTDAVRKNRHFTDKCDKTIDVIRKNGHFTDEQKYKDSDKQ